DKLLQVSKDSYDRKRTHYENLVTLAEANAALAGDSTVKLKAAQAQEAKAIKAEITLDKQQIKDTKAGTDARIAAQTQLAQDKKRLADLAGKTANQGFTLADFYTQAAADFAQFGSNLSATGLLSPQAYRGAIGEIGTEELAKSLRKIAGK